VCIVLSFVISNFQSRFSFRAARHKCKVMQIGHSNYKAKYEMNGKFLEEVTEERDLGVIMQSDLKCSSQCIKAVNTANRILGMIKRTISN